MDQSKNRTRNLILLIGVLVGFVVMLQIKSIKNSTIFFNTATLRELELQIAMESSEVEKLQDYIERKRLELDELSRAESKENILELLEKQRIQAKALLGRTTFTGSGLRVEVKDSDMEILPTQNPNDFLVHDQDILRIVNDLKNAGAEVISINDQIYKRDSEIKCSGPTITINGKTFGQPFIIRAIGDADTLDASIKSKDSYSYMLTSLFGIRVDSTKEESIIIYGSKKYNPYVYMEERVEE